MGIGVVVLFEDCSDCSGKMGGDIIRFIERAYGEDGMGAAEIKKNNRISFKLKTDNTNSFVVIILVMLYIFSNDKCIFFIYFAKFTVNFRSTPS